MSNEEKSVFEKINDSLIAIGQVLEVIATELYDYNNISRSGLPSPEIMASIEAAKQLNIKLLEKETKK